MSSNATPTRRAPGLGTITTRTTKNGSTRLEAQVVVRDADGKRKVKGKWYPDTPQGRQDAEGWISGIRAQIQAGTYDPAPAAAAPATQVPGLTLGQWMSEWLTTRRALVKASTHRSYTDLWRLHLEPELGCADLTTLTPRQLTNAYAAVRDKGTSASTTHAAHRTLRAALTSARKAGLITTNPAQDAELAKRPRYVARTWTVPEARQFLTHTTTSGDRNATLWRFMLATGTRRGEALGIQWADLDLTPGASFATIHRNLSEVGGTVTRIATKSDRAHREIPLDDETAGQLRTWRERTLMESATAPMWHDHPEVFVDPRGHHHTPDRITKLFAHACTAAQVPTIRLHDLRHTAATLWLRQGVGLKTVSTLLGHSSVAITGDVYAHVMPETARAASDVMAGLLS